MTSYTTRAEAIQREIIDPIEAGGEVTDARTAYDVDAIADEVLGDHAAGYAPKVDADEFWAIVERHARPGDKMPRQTYDMLIRGGANALHRFGSIIVPRSEGVHVIELAKEKQA